MSSFCHPVGSGCPDLAPRIAPRIPSVTLSQSKNIAGLGLDGLDFNDGKMAMKDSDLAKLQHADFWDNRYAAERAEAKEKEGKEELGSFEWFGSFEGLRPFFDQYLPKADGNPSVLHLGCGNSVCFSI